MHKFPHVPQAKSILTSIVLSFFLSPTNYTEQANYETAHRAK